MSVGNNDGMFTNDIALQQGGQAIQLSGIDKDDRNILSVIVKRTYSLSPTGKCERQIAMPLYNDFEFKEDNGESLVNDTDIYCNKPYTDVVVKGHMYSNGVLKKSHIVVEVSGQKSKLELPVFGKRFAFKNQQGNILFNDPEPIDKIPLEYDFAYGGVDLVAEQKNFELPEEDIQKGLPEFDWNMMSPYRYPRNTIGKGYVVENNSQAFEQLELPNFEDPLFMLSPANIVVGKPEKWIYQPLPRVTTWVNPSWFPRIAYFGFVPDYDAAAQLKSLPEHLQGLVDYNILEEAPMIDKVSNRGANGASLGLQFPHLNGNESIRLVNMHPTQKEFVVQLPSERPKIWVDGRKRKLLETRPVIQTVLIEPDENRVSIVWRGCAPALRPYLEAELKTMPFKIEWR